MSLTPTVLFEDSYLLILNKPAGLLSQGDLSGAPHVVDWARAYLGRPYVGLIHRLDRNVSGVLVLSKRTKGAERLTKALQTGEFSRTYLCVVLGEMKQKQKLIHYLIKDEKTNRVQTFNHPTSGAKEALLYATPLQTNKDFTQVQIELETGRSHQIRAQLAAIGHPVYGDTKYGKLNFKNAAPRIYLHSWRATLPHPISKEILQFEAPIPSEFQKL